VAHARDDEVALERTIELFKALGHPLRLALVRALAQHDRAVHELVDALEVPQPLVSQHLGVLRASRVVQRRRSGREIRYRLADHHVAHIVEDALVHAGETHDSTLDH
jgi:ArsR family transcriptional regulator, zinc-responsive transcriptional repressor